jgi:uncharacterized membrane protein YbhN (UPF0104 family)
MNAIPQPREGKQTDDARTRPSTRRLVPAIAVPVLFVVLLAVLIARDHDRLNPLWHTDLQHVSALAVLVLLGQFVNSMEFWVLYRARGIKVGLFENGNLFFASQLGNYAPGQIGSLYRLRYMRDVHGVSYAESVSVYGANFVATLGGASMTALVGVLGVVLIGHHGLPLGLLVVILGTIAAVVILATVPLPRFAAREGYVARAWRAVHAGFEQVRRERFVGLMVVALEVVKYALTAWRMLIAFQLLGVHEPYWVFLVLAAAAGVAGFLSFTPGALGIRELFITASAAALGLGFDNGLFGATIDRAVMLACSLVVGGGAFVWAHRRLHVAQSSASVVDAP